MALVLKDRVKQTAAAPGTGTITLGATPTGFQAFSVVGDGNTTYFAIVDAVSGDWEVNYGTYTSSGTTLSRNATPLSSSAGGALVNFTGSVDVFVTYPSENAVWRDTSGVVVQQSFGAITATSAALTTGTITTAPVNNTDIVNKQYADAIASGIHFHEAVELATTAALPANTYNNGTSGVGATLTANANGALSVDSTLTVVNNRVLVKNEAAGANNGVYVVTQVGSAGTPYILTRATDFDTAGSGVDQIDEGDFFLVTGGTANANTAWVQQTPPPIVVGTTALVFQQFAAPITYTAGTGLNESPTYTFNIANTTVTAATYGSASQVPVFAVNAQGQLTSVTNTAIAINGSAVSGAISGQAGSVANALTAGTYLTSAGTFDGSAARTFAVDATSTNTVSKVVARDSSGNFAAGTITAALTGNASTATAATNISAGAANQIPYQTGAATTSFIVAPTVASTFLSWTGSAFAYSAVSTPNSVTFNNGGSGDASGTTFNGSVARTISYNTVGAPSTGGTGATGTWGISISGNAATATSSTSSTTATTATNLAGGATGSIAYQSGAGATTFLADVATGSAVISGGVGVAPSYGKIGLTTHVSGTLPVANGGTGQTSFTANYIHYGAFSTSANFTYDGTTLAVAGAASGTAVSATSSGSTATILATDTGVNGSNIKLVGNGATTPNKFIRAQSGVLQVINSAYSAAIFTLSDAGAISSSTWNGSTIGIAYGGTNSTATPTAGGISYGTGTAYAVTVAGTTGQVITSAGAGVPTWTTATSANTASAIVQRDASGNFSAGTITAALTGNASTATSAATWTTARTLTVGATGKSVNGSANVSWTVAEVVGFTPVQQGGGTGQGVNKLYIGWLGSALGLQVDSTNFASTWPISVTGNAGTATTATTATNVAGGVAGNVHYQTGVGTTGFVTNGTAGQVLTSNGASAPTFQTLTAASKSYAQAMRILAF